MNVINSRISRGALIIIEGCDRSGKSTQSKKLVEVLKQNGINSKLIGFPARHAKSGTGGLIDSYLKKSLTLSDECIHLLFSANRWEFKNELEKELLSGVTIIVDRYSFSGIAYSAAKGMDFEWCKYPEKGLIKPDLVLFLRTPIDVLCKRQGFGTEIYEKEEFQKKVDQIFNKLCTTEKDFCQEINGNAPEEDIHNELLKKSIAVVEEIKEKPLQKLWV